MKISGRDRFYTVSLGQAYPDRAYASRPLGPTLRRLLNLFELHTFAVFLYHEMNKSNITRLEIEVGGLLNLYIVRR